MSDQETQGPKTVRQSVMLSEQEMDGVRLVAAAKRMTISDVIRDFRMAEIMTEYARLRPAVDAVQAGSAA